MKSELNRLDKLFGPTGSFAGLIILAAGAVMLYFSLNALLLIFFGAFVGFSQEGVLIDIKGKRIKKLVLLFGALPLGKWIPVRGDEKIDVYQVEKISRTFSRSNLSTDLIRSDYRVIFTSHSSRTRIALKKLFTREEAIFFANQIRKKLLQ